MFDVMVDAWVALTEFVLGWRWSFEPCRRPYHNEDLCPGHWVRR